MKLKALVPDALKDRLNAGRKAVNAYRALRKIMSSELPNATDLETLIEAWDNRAWSANSWYLEEIARRALSVRKPILECGSGLTTLIAAALGNRHNLVLHSLENESQWAAKVRRYIRLLGLRAVIHDSPLRSYDNYDWYTLPANLPNNFGLVICDGPPSETTGGRFGLLPVANKLLSRDVVILLDGANRAGERQIAETWAREFGIEYETRFHPQMREYIVARRKYSEATNR